MNWAGWTGCPSCSTGPASGALALLAWLLETYPQGKSQGIFNCRDVRGSTSLSIHACGRAVDFWLPYVNGNANPIGHDIVRRVGEHGKRLGVQTAIFARQIWSARSPAGRAYTGVHPHNDHIHWELTPTAADRLTLATLRHVLKEDPMPFTDIDHLSAEHQAAVRWAYETGITKGVSPTEFAPHQPVDRATAVLFLYRASKQ